MAEVVWTDKAQLDLRRLVPARGRRVRSELAAYAENPERVQVTVYDESGGLRTVFLPCGVEVGCRPSKSGELRVLYVNASREDVIREIEEAAVGAWLAQQEAESR